jgi:hypothetical protein
LFADKQKTFNTQSSWLKAVAFEKNTLKMHDFTMQGESPAYAFGKSEYFCDFRTNVKFSRAESR